MRWAPLHPRQLMVIALATMVLMLIVMLAAAPDLGSLDFSVGSPESTTGSPAPTMSDTPAPTAGQPTWVADPLAPPLRELGSPQPTR